MDSKELIQIVHALGRDETIKDKFKQRKCQIGYIAWEDTHRSKGSIFGLNISDVSLCVENQLFPIVRTNNFTDLTVDLSVDRFAVNVGNEANSVVDSMFERVRNLFNMEAPTLERITLVEYLKHLDR